MTTILIATRNAHKVGEIRAILGDGFNFLTLADFVGSPNVVEDAHTFEGNARKKAEDIARWLGQTEEAMRNMQVQYILADDSGLEVDALGGAPGVNSARYAALDAGTPGNSSDADNNAKLLRVLAGVPGPRRSARFRCVIALSEITNGESALATHIFQGACEGRIGFELQGRDGFGYDPLFYPQGSEKSFAILPRAQKNEISHRGQALGQLKQFFKQRARQ
jgi:XTP/dITP diphosphohydrolase